MQFNCTGNVFNNFDVVPARGSFGTRYQPSCAWYQRRGSNSGNQVSCNRGPHMSRAGFVISSEHGLIIPTATVESWQRRFSAIADLEAQMQKLASVVLKKGPTHPGWATPEAWMVGCLAEDNQKA